jgi:GNAT superfamily N-acetyltransferase
MCILYELLSRETLKTGETLEIGVVTSPDEHYAAGIEDLLSHKGEVWRAHIQAALQGRADRLETRFYLGLIQGQPVANIMTVERLGVGILGHVFTRPEHRRKGICHAVMSRQMEHFRQRGGHVLTLGTGFDSPPYWIYHGFGFRSLKGGFMRYAVEPDYAFEERWFMPAAAQVKPVAWEHAPLIALIASLPGVEYLRSAAWEYYGIENLERALIGFFYRQMTGDPVGGCVLETEAGAVVGCATYYPHPLWSNVWLVDSFTHVNFIAQTSDLLEGLPVPAGKQIAYLDTGAQEKAALYESCGFVREGTLSRSLRVEGEPRDVWVYGRER